MNCFHKLGHTFAILALQNEVDVKTVSGILGHFTAGFTLDTYAHVTTVAQRDAARKMDGLLGPRISWKQKKGKSHPGNHRVSEWFFLME